MRHQPCRRLASLEDSDSFALGVGDATTSSDVQFVFSTAGVATRHPTAGSAVPKARVGFRGHLGGDGRLYRQARLRPKPKRSACHRTDQLRFPVRPRSRPSHRFSVASDAPSPIWPAISSSAGGVDSTGVISLVPEFSGFVGSQHQVRFLRPCVFGHDPSSIASCHVHAVQQKKPAARKRAQEKRASCGGPDRIPAMRQAPRNTRVRLIYEPAATEFHRGSSVMSLTSQSADCQREESGHYRVPTGCCFCHTRSLIAWSRTASSLRHCSREIQESLSGAIRSRRSRASRRPRACLRWG